MRITDVLLFAYSFANKLFGVFCLEFCYFE